MAYINENNVSVSGGIAGIPFRFSAGNKHEEGLLKRHQLDRYATSLNLSPKFLDNHLIFDINSRFVHTDNFLLIKVLFGHQLNLILLCLIYSGDSTFGGYYETLFAAAEVMQVILYL